jgi:hypothetical protein
MKELFKDNWRLLTFRSSKAELCDLGSRHLRFGLFWTWLVGMGRWWDDPGAALAQHLGLGSLTYVICLATLLWVVMSPLKPDNWSWKGVLTFVTLTSPPAILYAIPVERFTQLDTARTLNVIFLAVVATWRVALLIFYLRRLGGLNGAAVFSGGLLPLTAIVTALSFLNLERAVFEVMAGLDTAGTANDSAYLALLMITVVSVYALLPLLGIYAWCCWKRRQVDRNSDWHSKSLKP